MSRTTLWVGSFFESLQPRIGYISNSSRSSDEPRGNEACHPSPRIAASVPATGTAYSIAPCFTARGVNFGTPPKKRSSCNQDD